MFSRKLYLEYDNNAIYRVQFELLIIECMHAGI